MVRLGCACACLVSIGTSSSEEFDLELNNTYDEVGADNASEEFKPEFNSTYDEAQEAVSWEEFKSEFNRTYNGEAEEVRRRSIFEENARFIRTENAKNLTYTLKINEFADELFDEFIGNHTGVSSAPFPSDTPMFSTVGSQASSVDLEASVDWVQTGAVSAVRSQGDCGSCWAFAAVSALESAHQIASGHLVAFSEQQLVDCDREYSLADGYRYRSNGCDGGWTHTAFSGYYRSEGVCTRSSYRYVSSAGATTGSCLASSCDIALPQGRITGSRSVDRNERALREALQQQPVAVYVMTSEPFRYYDRGVFTGQCVGPRASDSQSESNEDTRGTINHAVVAVGYGINDQRQAYFKIRNSWKETWGEGGYMRLAGGDASDGAACLFQRPGSYPLLSPEPTPRPVTPAPRPVTPAPRPVTPAPRPVTPAPRPVTPAPRPVTPAPRPAPPPARRRRGIPARRRIPPARRRISIRQRHHGANNRRRSSQLPPPAPPAPNPSPSPPPQSSSSRRRSSRTCIAGRAVFETEDGPLALTDVAEGMRVKGIDMLGNPGMCEVVAKVSHGRGPSYGNYTADHLMLKYKVNASCEVAAHGMEDTFVDDDELFNVLSNCVAITDLTGKHATAFNTLSCNSSWWSFRELVGATKGLLQAHRVVGSRLFDQQTSVLWDEEVGMGLTHRLCADLAACALDADNCTALEHDLDAVLEDKGLLRNRLAWSKPFAHHLVHSYIAGSASRSANEEYVDPHFNMVVLVGGLLLLTIGGLISIIYGVVRHFKGSARDHPFDEV